MLQQVIDEAGSVHLADLGVVILGTCNFIHAIVVEDLHELGKGSPLVKHTLNGHLDLKLARGFETNPDLFPNTFHDQLRQLQLILIQVLEVRAVQ